MNPPRSRWPSLGFLAVCLTYGLVAVFFLWGFSTPRLDRIWTIRHELKIGEMRRLKKSDCRLLLQVLEQHAWVASEFLGGRGIGLISDESDGWISTPVATILRTAGAKTVQTMVLDVQTPVDLMPYGIVVEADSWKEKIEVHEPGVFKVALHVPRTVAEIIEVRLKGPKFLADPSVLGLRITFPENQ